MSREHKALGATAAAVLLITLWLHWPSVHNGFLSWDDGTYLEKAIEVQPPSVATIRWAFTTTYFGNYHPLTWLSYIADWRIWGRNAAGHHATSVVLHALNAGLVVMLAWMLLRIGTRLSTGEQLATAAAVGLVFGIHPLQVESVAWISQRKTVLCGFFSLASLCMYLWYTQRAQARARLWAATALFVAALLSKAMALSLPVVMLAMDFYPLQRHRSLGWARLLKEKTVPICLAAAAAVVSFVVQSQSGTVVQLEHMGVHNHLAVWLPAAHPVVAPV